MGVKVARVFEYAVECDNCTAMEVVHTGDSGNGVRRVHDKRTAAKACGFHLRDGRLLCPGCLKEDDIARFNLK